MVLATCKAIFGYVAFWVFGSLEKYTGHAIKKTNHKTVNDLFGLMFFLNVLGKCKRNLSF